MPKKSKPLSYDQALARLRSLQFDVQDARSVAKTSLDHPVLITKDGCGAILARGPKNTVALVHKPGIMMGGEIAIVLDRGFQKFFKTSKLERATTYDLLTTEHRFTEEFDEAVGEVSLYNESLGSVSDEYMYDRVKGRDKDAPAKGLAPWDTAGAADGH